MARWKCRHRRYDLINICDLPMIGQIKSRMKTAGFIVVFTWMFVGLWQPFDFVPSVPEVRAETVVKTWSFASDAEGLVDAGNSAQLVFAHESVDNAVNIVFKVKNSSATEYGCLGPS